MQYIRLLSAFMFVALASFPKESQPTEKMKKLLGEKTTHVLSGATKVEVFRIVAKSREEPKPDDQTIGGHRVTSTAKDQDAKFAAKIANVLMDEKSYLWNKGKGCIFDPGVAFRIWKGEESVVMLICFECDQVQITYLDRTGKQVKATMGETEPSRSVLVQLAKAALPDDAEIQKLNERPK